MREVSGRDVTKNANVECHDTDVLTMKKKLALKKTVKEQPEHDCENK